MTFDDGVGADIGSVMTNAPTGFVGKVIRTHNANRFPYSVELKNEKGETKAFDIRDLRDSTPEEISRHPEVRNVH